MNQPPGLGPPPNLPPPPPGLGGGVGGPPPGLGGTGGAGGPPGLVPPPPPGLGLPSPVGGQGQGNINGGSPVPPPPGIALPSQQQSQMQGQSPNPTATPQPPPPPQPLNTFAHPLPLPPPSIGPALPLPTHGHHSHSSGGSVSTIVKAQIVFLLSTLTEESYSRNLSEIRQLIGQNSPEMYHHFLRRLIVVAAPVLQSLQSQAVALQGQSQGQGQGQGGPPGLGGNGFPGDKPLNGSLNVPPNGAGVLAWRVLQSEGVRAARDASLAPHFATTLLIPHPPATNPSLSLNYLQLTPNQLYSFASNAISSPSIILPESPIYTRLRQMIIDHYESVCASLRNLAGAFFPNEEDVTLVDARTFILAAYPRIQEEGGPDVLDRSKKALPRAVLPLNSIQRAQLLQLIAVRFSSPVIILQALPSISPGGAPDEAQTNENKVIPLASFLFELGESLTADEGLVASVIARWWSTILENKEEGSMEVEVEVARTVGLLVAGVEDEGRAVDIGGVVRGLTGIANVDWANVMREFDQPQTALTRPVAQAFLQAIIENAPTYPSSPVEGLLYTTSRWNNTLTLLKILDNLVAIPSDRMSLSLLPNSARLVTEQDFGDLAPAVQALSGIILNNSWNIKGLTQVLASVSKEIQAGRIRGKAEIEGAWEAVLEKGMKSASDLILLGFSMAEKPWSEAISSIVASLLAMFIKGQPTSQLVMSVMGRTQPGLLAEALQRNYEENEMNVVRVVECGQDAQILDKLLAGHHNALALDVASIASKRDLIDLESWVTDGINKGGDVYIQAVLEYLDRKANAERSAIETTPETAPLSPAVYATYFRALRNSDRLNEEDIGHFKEVRNLCLQLHPRLLNLNPDADEEPGLQVVSFPAEIDAQVDDFYQRMYGEEITLDYVIDVLKRLKKSDLPQDHQLFACMLHTLFDEYKFVHTYPPRELAMTGLLFGSIIQYRLVEGTSLHVAVRYVLDALQSAPESTMFSFGRNALNIFQSRLPEFPLMCRALLDIPHLHESSPVLMSIIRTALTDPGMDGEGGSRPSSPEQIVFPALRIEELDQDEPDNRFTLPDEGVSDRILFIVNNLAPSNFEEKAAELKTLLQTRYSRWFADYLVNTRVSVEPNNHGLYWQLLQSLDMPVLEKHVLWETYRKSSSLLNAEKTLDNSQDKSVLKNMASWLGKQTVARDLPVKHVHLALKDLLIQGYDEKRLQVAIPFVCKLMEHCSKSRVFHPPNPWLVAVMKLLSELYQFAELKLNLKFEIEVLCKSLDMNLAEIEATNILRSRTPPVPPSQPARLAQELDRITMPSNAAYLGQGPDQSGRGGQNPKDAAQQAAQDAFLRRVDELINQLPAQLIFGPGYPMFQSTTALKRIVLHSIDRALREIISPVVERSVTIAGISSRDLLMKDFGMESDDVKLRQAAHLMVSKLAGSLALVTCKEPLRTSMVNNIRTMMLQTGFSEENLPEQAIAGVVQDNLDIACNIIKTASQEKAVKDIDVNLSPAYAARRKQREAGQLFFDPSAFTNIVSRSALPESLRLTPHGLQVQQVRVYEDFGDQSRFTASVNQLEGEYPAAQLPSSGGAPEGMVNGVRDHTAGTPLGEVVESSIMTTKFTAPQSMDKFQELVMELDKHLQRIDVDSLGHLPLHHDVKMIIRQIPVIATQSAHTDQTALSFSQKIVQLLYKSDSNIGREVWVSILQRLCDLFPKAAKEVTQWLVYAEDIRKFNVPVTITLIRAGLINLVEYDPQTAKMIYREFALPVVDFAALLIHEALFDEPACAGRAQFSSTIEALGRAAANRRGTPAVARLLDDLSRRNDAPLGSAGEQNLIKGGSPQLSRPPVQEPPGSQSIDPDLRATLSIHFLEWVRLFTSPLPVETTFVPFVNRLQKQGILKGEEVSSAFYRNSIALAIDIFSQHKASGSPQMYTGVDALSKLIVLLLKNYSDTHGVASDSAKTLYFAKIFTIAALSLVRDHEDLGADFEQRPYFRFFSSLLYDLQSIQSSFPQAYMGCLSTFANHLGSIQPSIAPAFSYSWISLISHRYFMPRLLQTGNKDGWTDFYRLLMALFKFLNPFLEAANFHQASRVVFKGALRILLVVLKDFPEFLVEHYIGLCAAIPAHCIQLRNVVLCAFPRDVTIRLDIHSLSEVPPLPEFNRVPEIRTDYVRFLDEASIRSAVEQYITGDNADPMALLPDLRNRIAIAMPGGDGEPMVRYNLTLLYSLSLYLGASAVNRSVERNGRVAFDPRGREVTLLTSLIASLDGEGQHHFINSIVNQLRFPNAHTLFFMLYLLHLFSTAPKSGDVPERITRVLLERILAQRPHPWGLTTAFGELLHNEKLGFWEFPWVRAEPELLEIFKRCALR